MLWGEITNKLIERAYSIQSLSKSTQAITQVSCSSFITMPPPPPPQKKKTATSVSAHEPKKVHYSITIDEKLKMIKKYGREMPVTAVWKFCQPVSIIATAIKDDDCIRKEALGTVNLQITIITKKIDGPISKMENKDLPSQP